MIRSVIVIAAALSTISAPSMAIAQLRSAGKAKAKEDDRSWEMNEASEQALERGLQWLAANQGPQGNWDTNDLGLVAMGTLAFLSAGHAPGRGRYGEVVQKSLDYILENAKPSGLLNISTAQTDMYNHGLATFVLGQAHGMTTGADRRLNRVLDKALQLIANTQCDDGGWDYRAERKPMGHDLSLVVMQAKALRSAMDSGLKVSNGVVQLAIRNVREHYSSQNDAGFGDPQQRQGPGQFTYGKEGGGKTIAMAAAGVVCLQEFGQYDDWRIPKNLRVISKEVQNLPPAEGRDGKIPLDAYTLYYVAQALYQVNGEHWTKNYPTLRNYIVSSQIIDAGNAKVHGGWADVGARGGGRRGGKPGQLYGTAVACFVLAIPNRYLPILQEGKIESLRRKSAPGRK